MKTIWNLRNRNKNINNQINKLRKIQNLILKDIEIEKYYKLLKKRGILWRGLVEGEIFSSKDLQYIQKKNKRAML